MEPFPFARPDVICDEIDPWTEDGQTWRRLAVTFPATLPNHDVDQVFYFDERFTLRRMDYQFDGFKFYGRRRVYPRGADGQADKTIAVITIDTSSVSADRG